MTRLETAHAEEEGGAEALVFGAAGLISGLALWWLSSHGFGSHVIHWGGGLAFAVAMAAALFLTRAAGRLECDAATWVLALGGTVGLYFMVVKLLFLGWFSQAFGMPGWLNFGLCGVIGASLMGLLTATITRTPPGGLFPALMVMGGISALAAWHPFFLFPWWQTSVGLVLGLWVAKALEA